MSETAADVLHRLLTESAKQKSHTLRHREKLEAEANRYTQADLDEAIAEEREACARIADAVADVYNISFCIAHDIRARGK